MRGLIAALGAVVFIALVPAAQADVQPYGANDAGGFHDVLPPGTNGLANGVELAAFLTTGARPAHSDDQMAMYRDLMYATPGLKAEDLGRFYKDSTFGVKPADVATTISPRSDVTILRDKAFGVPHIYGTTRAGTMFGAGYAAAQDRLFFIDVLRHLGRAQLSSFIGGAPANRAMDAEQWSLAPYTEADFQRQFDLGDDLYGQRGRQLQDDALQYVAGVNQYIAEARLDPTKMPGEYAAIGKPQGPDQWKVTDLFATASLVGGIFGKGGGREIAESQLLDAFKARFGAKQGRTLWEQFAAFDDRDAPTTVKGTRFPYQTKPKKRAKGAEQPPDPGSFKALEISRSSTAPPATGGLLPGGNLPGAPSLPGVPSVPGAPSLPGTPSLPGGLGLPELGPLPKAMSNALLVSGANSASGRPLAVFGPQVAYFAPEILMEEDLHGPGIDAKGAAFPGVNLYVQLGHGRDYAWSATSAGQDIIDTFAVPLCDSTHYRFRGQCLPIEVLERKNTWTPNFADQTPPGSETLRAERTKLGLVAGRGTYKGKPMLYTVLRSTYQHEVDSAVGFSLFNEPGAIRSPQDFQRAAEQHRLHVQLVLHRRQAHRLLQLGQQPGAGEGDDRPAADGVDERVARLRPRPQHGALHAVRPAPAGRRPARADELEQPPGPGLRGRRLEPLQLGLPLADARSPARAAPAGRPQADAAGDGRRDGAGGHDRPARHDVAAAGAADPGDAEGPGARRRRRQAQGVVGERHAPHRP